LCGIEKALSGKKYWIGDQKWVSHPYGGETRKREEKEDVFNTKSKREEKRIERTDRSDRQLEQ